MRTTLLVLALVGASLTTAAPMVSSPQPATVASAQNTSCASLPIPVKPSSTKGQGGEGTTAIGFGVYEAVLVDLARSQVSTNYGGPPRCDDVVWVSMNSSDKTSSPMGLTAINDVLASLDLSGDWSNHQPHSI